MWQQGNVTKIVGKLKIFSLRNLHILFRIKKETWMLIRISWKVILKYRFNMSKYSFELFSCPVITLLIKHAKYYLDQYTSSSVPYEDFLENSETQIF